MQAMHLYKCPGMYVDQHGVRYDLKGVSSEVELEAALSAGWFQTIKEAAEDCGPSCLFKKRERPKRQKNKYAQGLPYVDPEDIAVELPEEVETPVEADVKDSFTTVDEEEKPEPKPEKKSAKKSTKAPKSKLSDSDKEQIVVLVKADKKIGDIAKKFSVSAQTIRNIKKAHGID